MSYLTGFITEYEGFTTKSIKVNTTPSVSSSEALVQLKYKWRHEGIRTTEWGDDPSQLYVLSHVGIIFLLLYLACVARICLS